MARREGAPTSVEDPTFAHGVLFFAKRDDLRDVRAIEKWLDGGTVGRGQEQKDHYDRLLTTATREALKQRKKVAR